MCKIYTARINYSGPNGLNITVKAADPLGRVLAPTWALVNAYKGKDGYIAISPQEYTERYLAMLRARYATTKPLFLDILRRDEVVLLCYCRVGAFCHRHLAVDVLERIAAREGLGMVRGGEILKGKVAL